VSVGAKAFFRACLPTTRLGRPFPTRRGRTLPQHFQHGGRVIGR
jgi:hypothetical protein